MLIECTVRLSYVQYELTGSELRSSLFTVEMKIKFSLHCSIAGNLEIFITKCEENQSNSFNGTGSILMVWVWDLLKYTVSVIAAHISI